MSGVDDPLWYRRLRFAGRLAVYYLGLSFSVALAVGMGLGTALINAGPLDVAVWAGHVLALGLGWHLAVRRPVPAESVWAFSIAALGTFLVLDVAVGAPRRALHGSVYPTLTVALNWTAALLFAYALVYRHGYRDLRRWLGSDGGSGS